MTRRAGAKSPEVTLRGGSLYVTYVDSRHELTFLHIVVTFIAEGDTV